MAGTGSYSWHGGVADPSLAGGEPVYDPILGGNHGLELERAGLSDDPSPWRDDAIAQAVERLLSLHQR
jgi:hypothetical protein